MSKTGPMGLLSDSKVVMKPKSTPAMQYLLVTLWKKKRAKTSSWRKKTTGKTFERMWSLFLNMCNNGWRNTQLSTNLCFQGQLWGYGRALPGHLHSTGCM